MEASALHGKVEALFRRVFDREDLAVRDETTAADVEGWDSLAQINLVVGAEEDFGVRFANAEIRALRNVGDFKALIAAKLAANG